MYRNILLLILMFFAFSMAARAAQECKVPSSPCMTECMNIGSALDASFCYRDETNKADKKLNEQYRRLMPLAKKYDAKVADALLSSQRAWIAYRDKKCALARELDLDNHDFEYKDCVLWMTRVRAVELQDMADFIENRL